MKLTQKTIFQCFEKPRKATSVVNPTPSKIKFTLFIFKLKNFILLAVVVQPSDTEIKTIPQQNEPTIRQENFLLPIHIRQLENSSFNDSNSSLTERKFDESYSSWSNPDFYRICPTIINNDNDLPHLQVFLFL